MLEIQGKFNSAKIFADTIDDVSVEQIKTLCDQEFAKDCVIRIMPDVHAGAGCTIGTTMTIKDKVVPNLVGVDIGCGMATYVLDDHSFGDVETDAWHIDPPDAESSKVARFLRRPSVQRFRRVH